MAIRKDNNVLYPVYFSRTHVKLASVVSRVRLSYVLITSTKLKAVGDIMLACRCVGGEGVGVGKVVFGRCVTSGVVRRSGVHVYRCVAKLPALTGISVKSISLGVSVTRLVSLCEWRCGKVEGTGVEVVLKSGLVV